MKDLIYCQHDIPRDQWRYGLRPSAEVGCGWIATYNALRLMGWKTEPEELIRYYQWQLPLIHGNAGTSFWGPALCLRQMGFSVDVTAVPGHFDDLARQSDACILFYRWRKKWKIGAHFVALHHQGQGFTGYNTFRNSTGPDPYGPSIEEFLKRHSYFGAVLIAIHNRPIDPIP